MGLKIAELCIARLDARLTMGNLTTLSARKLSSRPGAKAPPPEMNSMVVSVSTHRFEGPRMELRIFSLFLVSSFAWAARCFKTAEASLMEVSVGM
jgi:hypothetical protein